MLTKNKVLLYIFVFTVLSLLSLSTSAYSMSGAKNESTGSTVTAGGDGFIIAGGFFSPASVIWFDRKPRGHHERHEWHGRERHERHEGGRHERHERHERHGNERHENHGHHGRN